MTLSLNVRGTSPREVYQYDSDHLENKLEFCYFDQTDNQISTKTEPKDQSVIIRVGKSHTWRSGQP